MADKVIVLKDPFTGDRLFPVCSSKSIIDESGNPFDISKYLTQETATTLYAAKEHTHSIDQITDLTNQLNGKAASTHTHEIANINGLQTELDNLKTSGSEGKSLIASAITAKGVSTASDATFQQMATNIGNIASGNCIAGTNSSMQIQYSNPSTGHTQAIVTISDSRLATIRPTAIFCIYLGSGDCIYKNGNMYTFRWDHRGSTMGDEVTVSIGTNTITMVCEYQTAFSPPFSGLNLWFAYKV